MSQMTRVSSSLPSTETIPEFIPGTKLGLPPPNTFWKLYCERILKYELFSEKKVHLCSISKVEDYPLSSNPDGLFQHSCSNIITVFWYKPQCGHITNLPHPLLDIRSSSLLPYRWRQQFSPKRRYESIRQHGDIFSEGRKRNIHCRQKLRSHCMLVVTS